MWFSWVLEKISYYAKATLNLFQIFLVSDVASLLAEVYLKFVCVSPTYEGVWNECTREVWIIIFSIQHEFETCLVFCDCTSIQFFWIFNLVLKLRRTKIFFGHIFKILYRIERKTKILFFVTSPKLKILIKNVLLYRKRPKKVHLNIFVSVDQNPKWKG
jgi:hypothetical protein